MADAVCLYFILSYYRTSHWRGNHTIQASAEAQEKGQIPSPSACGHACVVRIHTWVFCVYACAISCARVNV